MYIYKITNTVNGKIYVGKAVDPVKRLKRHIYLSKKGVKRCFYNAIRQYGGENFIAEVLEECSKDVVNDRERFWISALNSCDKSVGYNRAAGKIKGGEFY